MSRLMPIFAPTSPGFGAVGSAHVWGARGRWFESSNPDLTKRADNRLIAALFYFSVLLLKVLGQLSIIAFLLSSANSS